MIRRAPMIAAATTAALLIVSTPALAQRWQLDVTGNRIGYDTAGGISSASFAPLVEWNRPSLYASLGGALAAFQGNQWTTQGHGELSLLFTPFRSLGAFRAEVVASADGSVHSGGYRTAGTRGELRLHVAGRNAGMWLGGAAATGWTTGATGIATSAGPTAGVWGRQGPLDAMVTWSPFRLQGDWYQQAEGRLSTTAGPVDLMGYVGWRGAPAASGLPNSTWGGASATLWVSRQLALVLRGGSYASDLLQALPRGKYISFGIRLSRGRPSVWAGTSAPHALYAPAHGEAVLRFHVPKASRVDIVGDWTNWQPVALERASKGDWIFRAHVASGVHRFNLIVNGKDWIAAPGVSAVDDGLGGKISLLVVP
ncbi:MAG TPA: glycogen-binding domain-containing protein [Gemmatimonadales bacterium]|nr:glycogen-binding domain-containing protein [Gemmatimonadales bacterium]